MSTVEIAAKDVKALRDRTGAGMMDCKKALTEAQGDIEKAIEILRVKQGKKIQDLGERAATEGTVQAYIHAGAKVGVLIEVDCNTDFVATNEDFVDVRARRRDADRGDADASSTSAARTCPQDVRDAEARIYEQEAADKPENVREKIVAGKLDSWYADDRAARAGDAQPEVRRQDRPAAARRADREDRRERRDPPLRALRDRPVGSRPRIGSAVDGPAFKRILLKLSGEALMGELEYGTDPERVVAVARQVAAVREQGVEVAIVVGAGNIYRGMQGAAAGMDRATADYMGMLATVLNALPLQDALEKIGTNTRVQSALGDLGGRRALHPPPRDAPPGEGPRGDLRRRHGQPVLHDRHRGGAARGRDPRRDHPDGQERRRGRLHGRSGGRPERRVHPARSRTWRRSSGACA